MNAYTFTREVQLEHLRSNGWKIVTFKNAPVVVAFKEMGGKVHAKAWAFKRHKTEFYHCFSSMAEAQGYAERLVFRVAGCVQQKTARLDEAKAKRQSMKAADFYAVGDVLYNSWGYDQTNVDFYQVVQVLPRSIRVRKIAKDYVEQRSMAGESTARVGHFIADPMLLTVNENGNCRYSKWDGKPKYESHYA
jgi:hypothetical protein